MKTPLPELQPATFKFWKTRNPIKAAKLQAKLRQAKYDFAPNFGGIPPGFCGGSATYMYVSTAALPSWAGTISTTSYHGGTPDPQEYRP